MVWADIIESMIEYATYRSWLPIRPPSPVIMLLQNLDSYWLTRIGTRSAS